MQNIRLNATAKDLKLGRLVQKLVKEQKYAEVISALDKISVPEGYQLSIRPYEERDEYRLGDESYVQIVTPNGITFTDQQKEFWNLLSVEDSPAGAWQVVILYNLWHYLPLFWHANYEKRTYLYSDAQMRKVVKQQPEFGEQPITKFDPNRYHVVPCIWLKKNYYVVSTYYWTDFGGLKFVMHKLTLKPHVHVNVTPYSRSTLFRYECGICF